MTELDPSWPVMVAYGGGTDSTGMLVELVRRRERVDAILFANTGGEQQRTYQFLEIFSRWLVEHGYPAITVVVHTKRDGTFETLEDECLRIKALPSLAYGWKKCSGKFKREPQDKWTNHWDLAVAAWAGGGRVIKLLGYDVDERRRADKQQEDPKFLYRHPLIEWGWGRDECKLAIAEAGLPPPGKSACFFCPASRKVEILALPPALKARAIALELNARENLTSVKGLGRRFAWTDVIAADDAVRAGRQHQQVALPIFEEPPEIACECYDGDGYEDESDEAAA